jgi:hypothetical protein
MATGLRPGLDSFTRVMLVRLPAAPLASNRFPLVILGEEEVIYYL